MNKNWKNEFDDLVEGLMACAETICIKNTGYWDYDKVSEVRSLLLDMSSYVSDLKSLMDEYHE